LRLTNTTTHSSLLGWRLLIFCIRLPADHIGVGEQRGLVDCTGFLDFSSKDIANLRRWFCFKPKRCRKCTRMNNHWGLSVTRIV